MKSRSFCCSVVVAKCGISRIVDHIILLIAPLDRPPPEAIASLWGPVVAASWKNGKEEAHGSRYVPHG